MAEIRPLDPANQQAAIRTVAQAFYDDPMTAVQVPDPEKQLRLINDLYAPPVKICLKYGVVDSIDGASALAMWLPPGKTDLSFIQMLQVGVFAMPFKIGLGPFMRLVNMLDASEKLHKAAVPGPHWYLMTLAVQPEMQGQGFGSKLLKHGLKRVDADGVPAYLETSNERNLPLYEKFGFKVFQEGELTVGGPPFWAMRRDALSG